MRQNYWQGDGYGNKHERVRFTCDGCRAFLGDAPENSLEHYRLNEECAGMNGGTHECTSCRKTRERAYDMWVLNAR